MAKRPLGEPKIDPSEARARLAALPWAQRASLTVGGLGFARFAPGTWGSLPPCVLVLALVATLPADAGWVIQVVLLAVLAWACMACVAWGGGAEQALGGSDPSCVVVDEVAGMCIAMLGLRWPLRTEATDHRWLLTSTIAVALAFILFRAFDVLKPPPCNALQRVRGGAGILLDDVFAGIYACVIMHLLSPLAG
jgi:phosphatidylglycerophosphatase A